MDFEDTPEEAAFRAEARAFLDAHAELRSDHRASYGALGIDQASHVERSKRWQRVVYDHGWAGVTWPREYGGRGGTPTQARLFAEEQARYDVSTGLFAVSIGMVGPTLIAHGTDDQKRRLLDPMLTGEHVWCQLFSEPEAGSDLAGLRTRAEPDGDEWVVNGQKVWTTYAHLADWAILLARTDPDARKHRGITYFLVDMATPGIEVRPLRQIDGHVDFNEVFLTDVRVPAAHVVGELHGGWGVAQTTLGSERALIGGGTSIGFADLLRLAQACGCTDDPHLRQELAAAYSRFEVLKYLGWRARTATSKGQTPGAEGSVMKLLLSNNVSRNGDLVLAMQGAAGALFGADAMHDALWQHAFLTQWKMRIGGGTDQVQRNVIGEHVLGLPREPRLDKDVPFSDLPRSGAIGA